MEEAPTKNEKTLHFLDTTDLMVYGHEPWLEIGGSHGHEGEDAELHLKWGHNMRADGLASREGMAAFVVYPGGSTEELVVENGCAKFHVVSFNPPVDGLYNVVSKNIGSYVLDREGNHHQGTRREYPDAAKAVLYNQYAQCIVPVGHDLEGVPRSSGTTLEIRPVYWKHWQVGETLPLVVFFRGEPLDGIAVDVAVSGPAGYRQCQEMTGPEGGLALLAEEPGRYLVIARHRVPECEAGVYDELSLTATLAFMVTK